MSAIGNYACAQFSKQLTSAQRTQYQQKLEEYSPKVAENKERAMSLLPVIDDKYKEEVNAIIDYYETVRVLSGYRYGGDLKQPSEKEINFMREYCKDLYKVYFLNGIYPSTPNYRLALSLRDKLQLSEETLRKLADKALEIDLSLSTEDSWKIEFKELSSLLDNDQMDYLLRKKNVGKTWKQVNNAWNLLCNYEDYRSRRDSINIRSKLYTYYYKRAIADELYAEDPVLKNEAYNAIRQFSPAIIGKVESLQRKQKRNQPSKAQKKNVSAPVKKDSYVWATSSNQSLEKDVQARKAIKLALGADGRIDRKAAFDFLKEYAEQKNATAMNALGLMYLKGYGTDPDITKALYWLEEAGDNGCSESYNNLGLFYKTEDDYLNLEKAFSYFSKAAEKGNINGLYFTGYMLYKGLGCEQSYEKAIECFKPGASDNYAPSLYMLGLCYRNGYGVEQNESTGELFLEQAAAQLYKPALKELELAQPENSIPVLRMRSKAVNGVPEEYSVRTLSKKKIKEIENGDYVGTLVTYDWSGKHIIEETPLTLKITSQGKHISGEWCEDGKSPITIKATIKDSKLLFGDGIKRKTGKYRNMTVTNVFQEADIQIVKGEEETNILGTLQMYSKDMKEKERPMYFSVTKKMETKDNSDIVMVYPNPFSKEMNLRINMEAAAKVQIYIHNMEGQNVYQYNAGVLPQGKQHLAIQPNLKKGTYIIKVFVGEKENQLTVISK